MTNLPGYLGVPIHFLVNGLAKTGSNEIWWEPQRSVVLAPISVNVLDEHVNLAVVALRSQLQQLVKPLGVGQQLSCTGEK